MEKQNDVHSDGYNLTTKPCSISKRNIGWRKPYTEMEKHLADMTRAKYITGEPGARKLHAGFYRGRTI